MRLLIFIFFGLIFLVGLVYFLTGFKSAFEADQSCHFLLDTQYAQSSSYGCDHDIETRQWLLYNSNLVDQPAKVIKRFRY